ncbi:unnamed protein product [Caenorhabditis nigoni]
MDEGSTSGAPVSKEDFYAFVAQQLASMAKEEKAPILSQKGLQVQCELNTKIINLLNTAMIGGDVESAAKEAVSMLKMRNQEIVLLDKDPNALKNLEKIRAISALSNSEGGKIGFGQRAPGTGNPESDHSTPTTMAAKPAERPGRDSALEKIWQAFQERSQSNVTHAVNTVITRPNAGFQELNKLVEHRVVATTENPRVVSPLQVAKNGNESVARQRQNATTVAENDGKCTERTRIPLTLEGPRQAFLEEITENARNRNSDDIVQTLMTALSSAKAASTMKAYGQENEQRRRWILERGLPLNEVSTVMYLAWKSESVGSGSLAKISAAYKMVNNEVSIPGAQCVAELINSKKRAEATTRKQPVCINEPVIVKIMSTLEDDAKSERDVLLVHLSYSALLRASEASNLQWKDVRVKNGLLEVFVAEGKNDQLGKGRTTFVQCKAGSDLDLLLKRWKVRCSLKNPDFIFHNLHNQKPLSPSSISSIVKAKFDAIEVQGSHHALRRGRANDLQAEGFSLDEIQRTGRWRSPAGMSTYLRDNPRAQGIRVEEMESEEEEEGPPSLTREAPVPL